MTKRAFTFVELLLLAVLICVVAIIGSPFFYDFDRIAREKTTKANLLKIHTQLVMWQSNERLRAQKGEEPLPSDAWAREENWKSNPRPDNEVVHLGGIKILSLPQRIQSCADLQAVYLEGGYGWVFEPAQGDRDLTKGRVYAVTDDCSKTNPLSW